MIKINKLAAIGLAAVTMMSMISVNAFASERTVTDSNGIVLVSLGNENLQISEQSEEIENQYALTPMGETIVVEEDNICKQLIQLNEYDGVYTQTEISEEGIILKNEDGTREELVPYYFEVSNLSNVRATGYPVYVIWHYDVRLRSSANSNSSSNVIGVLDYNTYFRGYSNSGNWIYGQVLNNNLSGRVGYVHNTMLDLAPDGNPYE